VKVDQFALEQACFDAIILRLESRITRIRLSAARYRAGNEQSQRQYEVNSRHSAANFSFVARALAPALSSAINSLARAIGLDR
jgi:hypothetical protein